MSNQQIIGDNKFPEEQDDSLTEQVSVLAKFCKENGLLFNDHKSNRGNYIIEIRPQQ